MITEERRRHPRLPSDLVAERWNGKSYNRVRLRDLCLGGARMTVGEETASDEPLFQFVVDLSPHGTFATPATVRHVSPLGWVGVEFIDVPAQEQRRLAAYVADLERRGGSER